MKHLFTKLSLGVCLFISFNAAAGNLWQQVNATAAPSQLQVMHPSHFLVYTMDEATLKLQMWTLSNDPNEGIIITLPLPDGSYRDFKVWQTPVMPGELSIKYADIKTFTAEATDDHRVTAKLDFTVYGFHAMVFDGEHTSFIDPFDLYHDGFYMVHYKADETRAVSDRMKCLVKGDDEDGPAGESMDIAQTQLPKLEGFPKAAQKTVNGTQLRTYRLALCANDYYCQAATRTPSPTIAACFSAMTTSVNRINGVYEREFSVTMVFVAGEDNIIWPTSTGSVNGPDPFYTINADPNACLDTNQAVCDLRIGNGSYDVGHVFTTGAGGLSSQGVVCTTHRKAQSVTGSSTPVGDGFDIDYVAHEMGHEFGGGHTFNNNNDGSCGGNGVSSKAYEPGSGSTIMAYAGICDPDNLQRHSDPYFHAVSLTQIITYINGGGNSCPVKTATGNKLAALSQFSASYTIPYKTPFELTGPSAVDSAADTANTYCWEEWNRGDFGSRLINTYFYGPIFRSYNPVYNATRIFPKLSMVLSGILTNAGTNDNEGEKAPDTARYLTFKMTVRDILNGNGAVTFPDDTIHLNVVSTGADNGYAGFKVTSPSTAVNWYLGVTETVTWNIAGTNAAPVSCDSVDIYISSDGGNTWPVLAGRFANSGTANFTLPAMDSTLTARVKVKGKNNVFFNINKSNFTIIGSFGVGASSVQNLQWADGIKVYPVPAQEILHLATGSNNSLQVVITNTVGQTIWTGHASAQLDIPVSTWAKGVYYIQFTNTTNGRRTVKQFVVE